MVNSRHATQENQLFPRKQAEVIGFLLVNPLRCK
jgi:hypothetical protein